MYLYMPISAYTECMMFAHTTNSSDGLGRPPLERHSSDYGNGSGRRNYGNSWGGGGSRGSGGRWGGGGGGGGRGPDMILTPEEWDKPLPRQDRVEA